MIENTQTVIEPCRHIIDKLPKKECPPPVQCAVNHTREEVRKIKTRKA